MSDINRLRWGPLRMLGMAAVMCALVGISQAQDVGDRSIGTAARMTERAAAFVASLDEDQQDAALFSLANNARGNWSNLPNGIVQRSGLRLSELSESQRRAVHHLLRASLSSQGYLKVAGVVRMDQLLSDTFANPPEGLMGVDVGGFQPGPVGPNPRGVTMFGAGNYFISFFNDPRREDDWGYLFTGHHLATSFTVTGGRVSFTPLFLGSQPLTIRRGVEAGWSPLFYESQRGFDLMQALSPEQQRVALVSADKVFDVAAGPGNREGIEGFEGLKASAMTAEQKLLLRLLVLEYVDDAAYDGAQAQLAAIRDSGWDELWFSWRGPVGDQDELFYYRVHGPRVLIELAWEAPNHIHAIMRDPLNDYGEDWLGLHYAEEHPDITPPN